MSFPDGVGGGWVHSACNRGFRKIQPVCKPGPGFDALVRDGLVGTSGVVLVSELFAGPSGFEVWLVIADQWFSLGDKIRSCCNRRRAVGR